MASFNVVVADPETGATHQLEAEEQDANRFMNKEIGDTVDGAAVGLDGCTLEITGGSDDAGRPMRADIAGAQLKEVLMKEQSVGYNPDRPGQRKRLTIRGRVVSDATSQINTKVVETGEQSVAELLGLEGDDDEDADEE
ncbi:30S ribosomal protein S6e [Haloarchaeobius amylolyticus]|uniref:30S ribosomal protein S6e n=1 Tax=Haloarchaeobius amylolyticus TaxID=1198296 RepID=UPI00226F2FEA|nr:30S ribosomal protein S6e [Haloarchaeobius amylolyticus]